MTDKYGCSPLRCNVRLLERLGTIIRVTGTVQERSNLKLSSLSPPLVSFYVPSHLVYTIILASRSILCVQLIGTGVDDSAYTPQLLHRETLHHASRKLCLASQQRGFMQRGHVNGNGSDETLTLRVDGRS